MQLRPLTPTLSPTACSKFQTNRPFLVGERELFLSKLDHEFPDTLKQIQNLTNDRNDAARATLVYQGNVLCFCHSDLEHSDLFRISTFGFRILTT